MTTVVAALLALTLPGLGGCGTRDAHGAPELRTGRSPDVCALDGAEDDSPATAGFIVGRTGTPAAAAGLDAGLAWVEQETGIVLTRERSLATGAVLLRAARPLGGQERVDLLCALERLAAVTYAEPDAEVTPDGTVSSSH